MPPPESSAPSANTFPSTRWSMVRLAVAQGQSGAEKALNERCRRYERPVMVRILRKGHSPNVTEDLKHAFFEHLLSKNAFADVSALKVKLRAFLIKKLQSFLSDGQRTTHVL